jgi:hypothetical protein
MRVEQQVDQVDSSERILLSMSKNFASLRGMSLRRRERSSTTRRVSAFGNPKYILITDKEVDAKH